MLKKKGGKMRKKKSIEKDIKIFSPESFSDIEDIIEILQESETSILVNMSKCKVERRKIVKIMDYILSSQKSYMRINTKKIFPKVFVCWSARNELYI